MIWGKGVGGRVVVVVVVVVVVWQQGDRNGRRARGEPTPCSGHTQRWRQT